MRKPLALIWIVLFLLSCTSGKSEEEKQLEEKLARLQEDTGLTMEKLEFVGIELDTIQRRCNQELRNDLDTIEESARQSKLQTCLESAFSKTLEREGVPSEALEDLRRAHIVLQWELKHFFRDNQGDVDLLKKVFQSGMKRVLECFREVKPRLGESDLSLQYRRGLCGEKDFYAICSEKGFSKESCDKIVSMGLDYNWEMPKVNVRQVTNPKSP